MQLQCDVAVANVWLGIREVTHQYAVQIRHVAATFNFQHQLVPVVGTDERLQFCRRPYQPVASVGIEPTRMASNHPINFYLQPLADINGARGEVAAKVDTTVAIGFALEPEEQVK